MYWSPTSNGATFTGSGQWSLSITGDSVYLRVADGEALTVHLLNLVELEVLGPLTQLAPGEATTLEIGWSLTAR